MKSATVLGKLQGEQVVSSRAKKVTTHILQEMKRSNEKIAMLTAYDYSLARLVDGAGVDVILVGDSASNVMAGNDTTVPITLEHMIYHAQCVVNAVDRALVVVDMPFGSYQGDSKLALTSAIRIMKESGGHAVKIEGGKEIVCRLRKKNPNCRNPRNGASRSDSPVDLQVRNLLSQSEGGGRGE